LAELERTQETLYQAEKVASLSNLVIGMAHELNTPIGTAKLSASLMDHQIGDVLRSENDHVSLNPACLALLSDIRESSSLCLSNLNKSAALISKFKMLSDCSTLPVVETRTLQSLVDETVKLVTHRHASRNLMVHRTGSAWQHELTLDSLAFHRALDEFLSNIFLHAYPQTDQSAEIWIDVNLVCGKVELSIADAGIGLSTQQKQRLFEPFFTRNRQLGVGVGATVAYNAIVQQLQGSVRVEDSEHGGICLQLTLPTQRTSKH
jgi:Amt family ammonium transporter